MHDPVRSIREATDAVESQLTRLDNLLTYLQSSPRSLERRDSVLRLFPEDLAMLGTFMGHIRKETLEETGTADAFVALGQIQAILHGSDDVKPSLPLTPTAHRINDLFLENKRLRSLNAELERQKAESKAPISRLQGILAYLSVPIGKPHAGTFIISAEDSALLAAFVAHIRKEALAESGCHTVVSQIQAILSDREDLAPLPLTLLALQVKKVVDSNRKLHDENAELRDENARLQPRCSNIDGDCMGCG